MTPMFTKDEVQQRERDIYGNVYKTAAELKAEEDARRHARRSGSTGAGDDMKDTADTQGTSAPNIRKQNEVPGDPSVPIERRLSVELAKELFHKWQAPMETLSKAGRAFEGLEALLGGADGGFDLSVKTVI